MRRRDPRSLNLVLLKAIASSASSSAASPPPATTSSCATAEMAELLATGRIHPRIAAIHLPEALPAAM
jgi:hypothetical protein